MKNDKLPGNDAHTEELMKPFGKKLKLLFSNSVLNIVFNRRVKLFTKTCSNKSN